MLEPPESLKSFYYIINGLVKSLRLVNQQETIFIIMEKIQSHIQGKRYEKIRKDTKRKTIMEGIPGYRNPSLAYVVSLLFSIYYYILYCKQFFKK